MRTRIRTSFQVHAESIRMERGVKTLGTCFIRNCKKEGNAITLNDVFIETLLPQASK